MSGEESVPYLRGLAEGIKAGVEAGCDARGPGGEPLAPPLTHEEAREFKSCACGAIHEHTPLGMRAGLLLAAHRARENARLAKERWPTQDLTLPLTSGQWEAVALWLEAYAEDLK